MTTITEPLKKSFKAQMLEARELAITASVNRLLAEKGFDAMTVDEVAAEVGIAKASLYKHFNSKEELACAAMVQAMQKAQAFLEELHAQSSLSEGQSAGKALNKLKATTRWTLELKLAGQMPTLPSHNSSLRASTDGQSTLHGRADERERLAG
jgi:TetR/AcrR family transcriptional regulator, regulator of autoinduction and epiphytic fitness